MLPSLSLSEASRERPELERVVLEHGFSDREGRSFSIESGNEKIAQR